MDYELMNIFESELNGMRPSKRKRFLHGVFKQVAHSNKGRMTNGKYRDLVDKLDEEHEGYKRDFALHLAYHLGEHGLEGQKEKLLKQEDIIVASEYFDRTVKDLQETDPNWRSYTSIGLKTGGNGVQFDMPGQEEMDLIEISVISGRHCNGGQVGRYEIFPKFFTEDLQLGDRIKFFDNTVPYLTMRNVVDISRAASTGDINKLSGALHIATNNF